MSEPTTISFYATQELKERLEQAAAAEGRSVSNFLRRFFEQHLPPEASCTHCGAPTIDQPCPVCSSEIDQPNDDPMPLEPAGSSLA
jgi:hypothetical protein